MGQQNTLRVRQRVQRSGDLRGIGGLAPGNLVARDLQPERLGDLRQAIAEDANGHGEDLVARREDVDDRRLHRAAACGRKAKDGLAGLEEVL